MDLVQMNQKDQPMANKRPSKNALAMMRKVERQLSRDWRREDREKKARISRIGTLFDPATTQGLFMHEVFSYLGHLDLLLDTDRNPKSSCGSEANVFISLTQDERSFTGWLNNYHWWVGDLQYRNAAGKKIDLLTPDLLKFLVQASDKGI